MRTGGVHGGDEYGGIEGVQEAAGVQSVWFKVPLRQDACEIRGSVYPSPHHYLVGLDAQLQPGVAGGLALGHWHERNSSLEHALVKHTDGIKTGTQ